ncbi:hypothetical protein HU200_004509 [Digitaria exilis]|uniref:USP8 dimerisation domain-containing protein n=1 Tax=Digitaria exilis TaxID=1010633 RepID=A0A835FSD8_9POAL|nr:hypothetical protein HU200_004509 [Digitaria exilis]
MAMGLSRWAKGDVSIESLARPVAVDHRISIEYYFRIADNLLRQADVYREEKNLIDLYIILLRYSSLLLETIPKHRDYNSFKSREKEFLKKGPHNSEKLRRVLNELESLKPVVQKQFANRNSGGAEEPNSVHGAYAASSGMEQYIPSPYMSKFSPINLKPGQLSWSHYSITRQNEDMLSVLSLDDGRWSLPVEEPASVSPGLQEEFSQLNIRQPSVPPVVAQMHSERAPIPASRVADPRPGLGTSETGRYQSLHVPVALMECFLRVAEANTAKNLETCGILAGILCQATNEEEIFEVQDKGSLLSLGWIHIMLPEAIAIVMAPTDTTRKHGIFHLTDPCGMGVIHDCDATGFHPHEEPLDGTPIYEHCSHVYMNPNVKFEMVDLREA